MKHKVFKYDKLTESYNKKIRKIINEYTEKVCKLLDATDITRDYHNITNCEYRHIMYKNIKYQSGNHNCYYYNGASDDLHDVLYKEYQKEIEKDIKDGDV